MANAPDGTAWEVRVRESKLRNRLAVVGFDVPLSAIDGYDDVIEDIDRLGSRTTYIATQQKADEDRITTDKTVGSTPTVIASFSSAEYDQGDRIQGYLTVPSLTTTTAGQVSIELVLSPGGQVIGSGFAWLNEASTAVSIPTIGLVADDVIATVEVRASFSDADNLGTISLDGSNSAVTFNLLRSRNVAFEAYDDG